jgi:hypothetical protein
MSGTLMMDTKALVQLRELVDALDRRVPQVERAGEAAIARSAAALRTAALDRIRELEASSSPVSERG